MNPVDDKPSESRRDFFKKSLTLIPLTVIATQAPGLVSAAEVQVAAPEGSTTPYHPVFFNDVEWAFVCAACARLIPKDGLGRGRDRSGRARIPRPAHADRLCRRGHLVPSRALCRSRSRIRLSGQTAAPRHPACRDGGSGRLVQIPDWPARRLRSSPLPSRTTCSSRLKPAP